MIDQECYSDFSKWNFELDSAKTLELNKKQSIFYKRRSLNLRFNNIVVFIIELIYLYS